MQANFKKSSQVKVGEKYTCPRCGGKGYGTWHVQMGTCFKCFGTGEVVKVAKEEILIKVTYKVQVEGKDYAQILNTADSYNSSVSKNLWIGDKVIFQSHSNATPTEATIIGKHLVKIHRIGRIEKILEEKKSSNYEQIKWL